LANEPEDSEGRRIVVKEIARYTHQYINYAPIDLFVDRCMSFKVKQIVPLVKQQGKKKRAKEFCRLYGRKPGEYLYKKSRNRHGRRLENSRAERDASGDVDPTVGEAPTGTPAEKKKREVAVEHIKTRFCCCLKHEHIYSRTGSLQFSVPIGDARSTHIELQSPDPANIVLDTGRTYIEIGRDRLHPEALFGDSSSNAQNVQHFYTTKTRKQIDQFKHKKITDQIRRKEQGRRCWLFKAHTQDGITGDVEDYNIHMRAIYTPIKSLRRMYWFSCGFPIASMIAFTIILIIWGIHVFNIPSILGLGFSPALITVLSLRERVPIISVRMEQRKIASFYLMCASWLYAVTLICIYIARGFNVPQ
jgi:hypothetical protein